jgi:hypothetical protein
MTSCAPNCHAVEVCLLAELEMLTNTLTLQKRSSRRLQIRNPNIKKEEIFTLGRKLDPLPPRKDR